MTSSRTFAAVCVGAAALLQVSGCSDAPSDTGPAERTGTSRAALEGPNGIGADLVLDSEWGQGYCARIVVRNEHPSATTGTWSVEVDLGASTTFATWDGAFGGNTGLVTVTAMPQNQAIPPSEERTFGWCASIPSPGIQPVLESVSSDLPPPSGGAVVTEYKLPALRDPMVSPDFDVELWASFYRPETLETGRQYPLLMFLHGNHPTCGTGDDPRIDDNNQYRLTGTCPEGYTVVPNHRGYDYIATDLAERGYFVVSINTNRGINGAPAISGDEFVIAPRGRLLLRHLERLSAWDAGVEATPVDLGVDLEGRIDFGQVGLFGHSRGGEGVRFAYNEYRRAGSPWPTLIQSPVTFRGIFEIGPTDEPVDGQLFNASDTAWNVILPACDWDLPQLPGVRVFDRMLNAAEPGAFFKSFYHVWGTNHNYYNSEWQIADANSGGIQGCLNHEPLFDPSEFGSPAQREVGRLAAVTFFTANVGADRDPSDNVLFDPAFPLPVEERIDRGYHPGGDTAESLVLEDFTAPAGTSSYGLANETGGAIGVQHFTISPHDPSHRGAFIDDIVASASTYFQSNWAPAGSGFDLTSYDFLDLRANRAGGSIEDPTVVSFRVELVNADDTRSSSVSIDPFLTLGAPPRGGTTLPTARIPLAMFTGADLGAVRAVRLVFDTPVPSGFGVFVANIRATLATTPPPPVALLRARSGAVRLGAAATSAAESFTPERITTGNLVERVARRADGSVEITLRSDRYFDARARQLVLSVGDERTRRSEHPGGDLYRVRFVLPRASWEAAQAGQALRVDYGPRSPVVWEFGPLSKDRLGR